MANTAIFALSSYSITLKYQIIKVKEDTINPIIEFIFDASIGHNSAKIINLNMEVSLFDSNNKKFIIGYGNLRGIYNISYYASTAISIILQMDYNTLNSIEKIRAGKDIKLNFDINLVSYEGTQSIQYSSNTMDNIVIHQSDWINNIINKLDYKNKLLLELPKLKFADNKWDQIGKLLEGTFRTFYQGEWDLVLANCRKILEELSKLVKNEGYTKEVKDEETGIKKKNADWKELFGSDSKGDMVNYLYKKFYGVSSGGGSHASDCITTTSISYFSLLQILSFIYLTNSQLELKCLEKQNN